MYCRRTSMGLAPLTSMAPRFRMSGERMSPSSSAYALTFLAQRAEQTADDFALAVQRHQPLLERSREAQVVVHLTQLRDRQSGRRGRGAAGTGGHDAGSIRASYPTDRTASTSRSAA